MAEQDSWEIQGYCIDFSMIKEKYHPQRNKGASKIRSYCKDIERYTNARIKVDVPQRADRSRRDVKFEIQGQSVAVQKAVQSIQGEFIFRKKMPDVSQDRHQSGVPLPRLDLPGLSGPRKAAKTLDKRSRQMLAKADPNPPHLLTQHALRMHDIATGTCQLRQFACEPCDNVWWRVVSFDKAVSRCKHCRIRYDAISREFEYGIGLFTCDCGHEFKSKCTAQSSCPCFECGAMVVKPYIHPSFKPVYKPRSGRKHYCDVCHGKDRCPTFKKVVYASTPHDSTGSTLSTFLSQMDFNGDDAPYFEFGADGFLATRGRNGDDAPYFEFGALATRGRDSDETSD